MIKLNKAQVLGFWKDPNENASVVYPNTLDQEVEFCVTDYTKIVMVRKEKFEKALDAEYPPYWKKFESIKKGDIEIGTF